MIINELKHQDAFSKWLPNDFAGKANYVTGLKSIQNKLNSDVDTLLADGLDPLIHKLTPELFGNNIRLRRNAVSHIKKYHAFHQEKFNKVPFKRKESFEKWLPENGVNSTSNYVAHISTIQKKLKTDIDELLSNGLAPAMKQINHRNFKVGNRTLSDKRAILTKYFKFMEANKQP